MDTAPKSGPRVRKIPDGDDRPRLVCPECDFILYENPKIVVGSVCFHHDELLLCRRAIEPRTGYWTMPAGYLELGETTYQGAEREAYEEAGVTLDIGPLLAIYNLPHINQVQIFYKSALKDKTIDPGPESLEAGFFKWKDIPWEDLAFPTVRLALEAYKQSEKDPGFLPDQQTIKTRDPSAL